MAGLNRPPYTYEELAIACERPSVNNIYAVVTEFSIPRRSRGTDFVSNLLLVDPSSEGRMGAAEMLAFAPSEAQLPRVRQAGDIIRLHRVKVQFYNGKPQLIGKIASGAQGAPFAFCLFDSALEGGEEPYQCSSSRFHWDRREGAMLHALRHYVAASNVYQLAPRSEYVKTIQELRPHTFVDLVVKVVGYGEVAAGGSPSWGVIFAWDGTDTLPVPYGCDMRTCDEERVSPELQQRVEALAPIPFPLQDGDGPPLPALGTVLPIVVQGGQQLLGSSLPGLGTWVKLRNVGVRIVSSQVQAYYTRASKWAPWQEEVQALQAYQRRLALNQVAGWAPEDPTRLLARSLHPHRPYTPIRQVVQETPCGVARKYRVLARVMAHTPTDPALMTHTSEECGLGGPSGRNGTSAAVRVYTLKLLLEDATGQVDALLFGEDAAVFFGEPPPLGKELVGGGDAAGRLVDSLERLMGKGYQGEGGPWVDVCLKAYYSPDASDAWENRHYMIFDTLMT